MRLEAKKQWYAVYTRLKWERKVTELLLKKKIQAFCPLTKIKGQWADRKKSASEPLFSSYVFVYIPDSEKDRIDIKKTDGIVNFVHWLNAPVIVPPDEIETIKKILAEYEYVSVEKSEVKIKDQVKIVNGPLMMWEGSIIEIKTSIIKITLPTLGHSLIVEIKKDNLNTITALQDLKMKAG